VSRFTDAEEVLTDTTPENVAELLKQGATTGSLNKALELPGFGVAAATEALAILEPERFVALNNRAESGLEALQFNPPNPGVTSIRRYEEFSNQVDEAIDKYDFRSIVDDAPQWATPYQIATCAFYRHSEDQIDLTELLPDSETQSPNKDQSPQTEDIDYYWVNQNREIELREGYLRSQDQQWQRDLTVLEPGDIVFHYTDQAIRACSVVTKEAYQTEMDSGEYYRVEVSTNNLDTPLPLSNVRDALQDPDRRQDQNRYPLDKNGNVIQAYLCHLSSAAGEYLLKEANVDLPGGPTSSSKNYFWATANPSIWSVDEIAEGGDVLYTAYNDKGNKKRLFDAFKTAAPGDRVLFYESTPVKEIVGEGTVIEGLDTTTSSTKPDSTQPGSDDESDTEAGIRIQFERRVDGISWNDLTTIPDLEDAVPIANRAQGSFFP
jgi:predicted RNA-binding protein with PUA-like domain